MKKCYEKGKPHNSGKAIVGPFPLPFSECQQRKTLNVQTSMNLTFMFVPRFYPNHKVNPQKIESKLFRAENDFALYRTYQISHVRSYLEITVTAITVLIQHVPTCFPKIMAFLEVLDMFKTNFIRYFNFFQILTPQGLFCLHFPAFCDNFKSKKVNFFHFIL